MTVLNVFRALGPIDMRNIRRDSLLRWMAMIPFIFAFLFRYIIPWMRDGILQRTGFDFAPYYILLISYGFVIGVPTIFGVVIGFLLLDEKDDQTLTALQVTPLTLGNYMAYRVIVPVVMSIVLILITYPLAGMVPMPTGDILIVALLAAPMAPIFALFLASVAQNKVQGFAIMKGSGSFLILPLAAYFFDGAWTYLLGIIPTFWPVKAFWMLEANEPGVWTIFIAGMVVQAIILAGLMFRFNKIMHR
ncbi:MAG: hypothetical protein DWQ04_07895 [Chloroflexi bacterium]|nr:MAG: hypothetical protein DWQ04_07895 [Chloroflexota bacterium]